MTRPPAGRGRPRDLGRVLLAVALLRLLSGEHGFILQPWHADAGLLAPRRAGSSVVRRQQAEAAPNIPSVDIGLAQDAQVMEVKERLREAMHLSTIAELERAWSGRVIDISQLQGDWTMQVPTVGNVKKWMKAHGAVLGLGLVGSPKLSISPQGTGVCLTNIKWGPQRDTVTQRSHLSLMRANIIRDKPVNVRTKHFKMQMPHLKSPRTIRVTYLDSELMIIRDSQGAVDALWKEPVVQAPPQAPQPPQRAGADVPAASAPPPEPQSKVDRLQSRVEALTAVLEASQARAEKDRELRAELAQEATELEEALEQSAIESQAIAARLEVLEGSQANAQMQKSLCTWRAEEETAILLELGHKAEDLEQRLIESRSQSSQLDARVVSLRAQVRELSRGAWGFGPEKKFRRAALAEARREVQAREAEAKVARQAKRALDRELKRTTYQLERQRDALDAATIKEMRCAKELEVGNSSFSEEQLRRAAEQEKREALGAKLATIQSKLSELERRAADVSGTAADVERKMEQVAAEARQVRKAARSLQQAGQKRRFWR